MISEPELEDEQSFGTAELLPGQRPAPERTVSETVTDTDLPSAPRRPRTAWLWALGGAATASALWAGGLYAYGQQEIDLGGYRTSRNLCLDAELKAVSSVLGKREGQGSPWGAEHTSLDRAACFATMKPIGYEPSVDEDGNEISAMPSADISYLLHKKTDPGPEYDATIPTRHWAWSTEGTARRIEGVGERAYLVSGSDQGTLALEVLDGQAVLRITVSSDWDPETGETVTDLAELEPLLVEDMLALMATLRKS